jgi:hypothetical protein
MRLLLIHSDFIEYEAKKKTKFAEEPVIRPTVLMMPWLPFVQSSRLMLTGLMMLLIRRLQPSARWPERLNVTG